nr:immunoglobulin heavy chain junction region [Macaca mulatta]MOW76430.1 immunoglobulin heavy chain junction region [Macaca mulatta]MOW76585.1 immunoglobulin heavy chain junction region [Macaca mulatta]MOW76804.1 immunoglobulin heavy chain junction region [Macaca mulatta]MOW80473.1 immunoglobulin heavy chain junction region [Macaca mulatta]
CTRVRGFAWFDVW